MVLTLNAARLYDWAHLTFIGLYVAAFAVSLLLIKLKVKSDRAIDIIVKSFGGVLLALLIFNRIAIACHRESGWGLLPDSFCGVGSLGLAISCLFFKRGALPYHVFVYCMVFGGLITVFYPDFLGQEFHGKATSFIYPATISGMLHHSLAAYISVFLLITGHFKPCVKKTYALPIAMCFILVYGQFLIDACGFEKAMYIGQPLIPGTFIAWYVVEPALAVFAYAAAFLYEYIVKKKTAKTNLEYTPYENEATEDDTSAEN